MSSFQGVRWRSLLPMALCALLGSAGLASCQAARPFDPDAKVNSTETLPTTTVSVPAGKEVATFGTGCFWCTEAVFEQLKGVESATSGYAGGHVERPTYEQVCGKTTGHAEVIQVIYDPSVIGFKTLLEVFWKSHDPTTPNQQGADHGPQYRSAIFYHNAAQKELAETYKKKLDDAGAFPRPIVTEITPFTNFYPAENYHQEYYALNSRQPYCALTITPKLAKLRAVFADKLKVAGE